MKFGTLSSSAWGKLTRRWFAKKRDQIRKGGFRFESLEARLAMAAQIGQHIHPNLQIYLDGQKVTIPANIGIQSNGTIFSPHTHDTSGDLHLGESEALNVGFPSASAPRLGTLDDFFDVWRGVGGGASQNVNAFFDSTRILDRTVNATHTIRMYVNGVPNTQFEQYVVQDRDQIVISYESTIPAGTPTVAPIETQELLAGSPLYIPLNGVDPDGQNLTYTVTSSNPSLVSTYVPTSNPSLRINVAEYGEMIFQLFQDKASRPVDRVVTLANQGFYNGLKFHRILNDFVIQGGDPNGTGTGGSNLGNFDDQFHVDLQHNRTGLLSFAKTTDDTNNSQFYITEGDSRHLDFNHSIFGLLVKGENVRDMISNAAVTAEVDQFGNNKGIPVNPVVMSSVSVFQDTQNGVLMLKAAEGATGTATITVTATDTEGKSFQRVFTVNIKPDTVNGGPFLQDIAPITIQNGKTSTFQLSAVDVEGNPVTYEVVKQGSQNQTYDLSVNAAGVVSITPPTGFVGTLQVLARVKATNGSNTSDTFDSQLLNINVTAAVNLAVDLAAGSDSGVSDSDNITNATTTNFTVTGTTSGQVIRLYSGSTLLGEQTASGSSVSFAVNNLAEGGHNIVAKLFANGAESNASSGLAVTVDRTSPEDFTTTAPALATVSEPYVYNVGHPDEAAQTIVYSLANVPGAPGTLPSGMSIDPLTGVINWTPAANQAGSAHFRINATDTAGNVKSVDESITVNEFVEALADIKLEIVDINGNVLTSVGIGQTFFVRGSVRDRRPNPANVFSFYTDLNYDPAKVQVIDTTRTATVNGQPVSTTKKVFYGSEFGSGLNGGFSVPGLVDEIGAISDNILPPLPPGSNDYQELFQIQFRATAAGPIRFEADAAEATANKTLLFDNPNHTLSPLEIRFLGTELNIETNFTAVDDIFSLQRDSVNFALGVLNNDTSRPGTTNNLTITATGTPQHGTVSIAGDGKSLLYTPTPGFFGQDTFTYTVKNQNDETQTATVTLNVTAIGPDPEAKNDERETNEDTPRDIDVLSNDVLGLTSGSLKVKSVSGGSAGGTIAIQGGGNSVRYTPATNFFGTETFTYVIEDNNGKTSTATVTVVVKPTNDNPTAANDSQSVTEDSSNVVLNVLGNDNSSPDAAETLTITAVGTPSRGGAATIAPDGKSLLYTPAPNFFGEETITYTISDGNGGTATAQISVNVVNTNDAPTVANDTVTGFKNTTDFAFTTLLSNDTSSPDPTENLVISAVSNGSQGGTLKVSADGKSVLYTPATNFTGTETFTYTVRDPGGLTTTGTVTVNVQDFIPSSLSGRVYIDANKNGQYDGGEVAVANVLITLTGTAEGNQAVNQTLRTLADGTYNFTNLAPGTYVLKESQPEFMDDGRDQVGSQGATDSSVNDQFSITLAQNTQGVNNNFGELGMPLTLFRVQDLFAKRVRNFVTAAVGSTTTTSWGQSSGTWSQFTNQTLSLTPDGQSVKVQVTNGSAQQMEATVPLSDTSKVLQLQEANGQKLVRLLGDYSAYNFTQVGGGNNGTNNAAPSLTVTSSSVVYTENGTQLIDEGILVNDADSANLTGAVVSITTNFNAAEDVLEFTAQSGISGSYDATTGKLTFTGTATLANYQTLLRSVKYRNSSNNPSVAGRTVSFQVNDGSSTNNLSTAVTRLVTITTVNDAPVATASSGGTTFTAGGGAVNIDANINVSDVDSTVLTGATISLGSSFVSGQDSLLFTDENGIVGSFNASNGQLTLTGNSTVANYQAALRKVRYNNSSNSPNTAARAVTITVTDGGAGGTSAETSKSIIFGSGGSNTAPVVTMSSNAAGTYSENGADVVVDASLTLVDADSATMSGATITITSGLSTTQDRLIFSTQNGISGSYVEANGTLTLSGIATRAQYEEALRTVKYRNVSEQPTDAPRTISFVVNDGSANNNLSASATKTVNLDPINDAPTVTVASSGLNYAENAGEVVVDDTIIVSDVDNSNLTGANVSIKAGFAGSEDLLVFENQNGISGSYNTSSGVLALTGSASLATYQAALRTVKFRNSSDSPTVGPRTIEFVVGDGGSENNQSAAASRTVTISETNDAPLLSATPGALAYAEGAGAVAVDPGLQVNDPEGDSITGATVTISSGYQNGQDTLEFVAAHGITGTFSATTGKLELTGTAAATHYQDALRSVKFLNSSDTPVTTPRTITFQVTDNGSPAANSALAARVINVSAVNDAPVITAPASEDTVEGVDIVFSNANGNRISIADVDAGATDVSVTLTADHGTLDLGSTTGVTFDSGDGTGDATMTFRGPLSAINAVLATVTFHPAAGYVGPADLQITVSDLGHNGSGGVKTDAEEIAIAVAANGGGNPEGEDAFFASLADDPTPSTSGDNDPNATDELFAQLGG